MKVLDFRNTFVLSISTTSVVVFLFVGVQQTFATHENCGPDATTYVYETAGSGNWSDASTWHQCDTDLGPGVIASATTPNVNSPPIVTILAGHVVTSNTDFSKSTVSLNVDGRLNINKSNGTVQLTLNVLGVKSGGTLSVEGTSSGLAVINSVLEVFAGGTLNLNNGDGRLHIKSTTGNSATLKMRGTMTGTGIGEVTFEGPATTIDTAPSGGGDFAWTIRTIPSGSNPPYTTFFPDVQYGQSILTIKDGVNATAKIKGLTLQGDAKITNAFLEINGHLTIGAADPNIQGFTGSNLKGEIPGPPSGTIKVFGNIANNDQITIMQINVAGAASKLSGTGTTAAPITILNAATLTLDTHHTLSGLLTIDAGGTFNTNVYTLTLTKSDTAFTNNGTLSFAGNGTDGTIKYAGASAQTITGTTYRNLTTENASGLTASISTLISRLWSLVAGLVSSAGNATMSTGATISRTGGSVSAAPVFGTTVNVTYPQHSAAITTGAEIPTSATVLNNFTVNSTNNVTLNANTTVNGALTLTAGTLTANANLSTVKDAGSVSRTSGFVAGDATGGLVREFPAGAAIAKKFDIGANAAYIPVTVTFDGSVTTAGTVNAAVVTSAHAQIGSSGLQKTPSWYFRIDPSPGLAFTGTISLEMTVPKDQFPAGATFNNLFLGRYKDAAWTKYAVTVLSEDSNNITFKVSGISGFSNFVPGNENGAALTSASDTLSSATPGGLVNHDFKFTIGVAVTAANTIKIQLDPIGDAFNIGTLGNADLVVTGATLVAACGAGAAEVTAAYDNVAPDINILFTVCAGDTVNPGAFRVQTSNTKITNPAAGSYVIRYLATDNARADTRVAIVADVNVTASIDTTFTFTVVAVALGAAVNGDATVTSAASTATTLPFGTLAAGVAKVLAHDLQVTTNARNGFVVTTQTNAFDATNGADIDVFKDGAATAGPTAWTAPLNTLDNELTYGHWGITSEDDLNADEFGAALYAGNFLNNARSIFSHTGPADGATANKGKTRVGYKVEIASLQEAGSDYDSTVKYIATPTF